MKVVILAGGKGTRISEESVSRPKPLVEIGGFPFIWHIMKIYSQYGLTDFVICLGYRGYMIKEYFSNYFLHMSDVTFDMKANKMKVHRKNAEDWRVTLVDTGLETNTGGRLKRAVPFLDDGEDFALTYGDGVADIEVDKLVAFHKSHGKKATVTAVQPALRFGALETEGDVVRAFREKATEGAGWVNGGFFVLSPDVCDLIDGDNVAWEREPLETLAASGDLKAYYHDGFWHPMDTLRDKIYLDQLWSDGEAPWKMWQ
jgi:glucose-1-phosphate cytidylyltransferase